MKSNKWTLGSLLLMTSVGHSAVDIIETNLRQRSLAPKFENVTGHIGVLSNQTSDQVGNVPGNRLFADFDFDYYKNTTTTFTDMLERRFKATALVNDQSLAMYSIPEAYVGIALSNKDTLRLGRQILDWTEVDRVWGFGKFNNRQNFDYFVPEREGLIGLLYERKSSNGMRYRGFVSGLYVPETNPSLDIDKKNRTITSRSPWADVPATRANVDGVLMDVKYDVEYPEISDVVQKYSVGGNIGWENKHWVFDNFIMRKPENTTTPDVEVSADFTERAVHASIVPRFYYHDLYGSTLKYRNLDYELYVSGIAVRPNEYPDVNVEAAQYTKIKTKKRREDYVGGGISKSNDLYTVAFNYVARLSPFDRRNDDLSPDPRWNQAVNIFALRNFGRRLSLATDIKFDMLTTDRLVMVRGNYFVTNDLQVNVGVHMIGTPTDGKSFWAPYTNNDAIYGGMRYVF